jgi:3-deoxy-D-manno-octulosonic-acid transferase
MFSPQMKQREADCKSLLKDFPDYNFRNEFTIWFHVASMGEFEQAKPLIEMIKSHNPELKLVVSFFSPSGYNNQINYRYADYILYLPLDTKKNAHEFICKINPNIVIFVRYEIWHNYLVELKIKNIPAYLICATKPSNKLMYENPFFKNFTKWNYSSFRKIYTVGEEHTNFFKKLDVRTEIQTTADIRFDRILSIIREARIHPIIPREIFFDEDLILVAGSSWEPDEDLILSGLNLIHDKLKKIIRLVLVPHEPTEKHLALLTSKLHDYILLSQLEEKLNNYSKAELREEMSGKSIVVDSIGKLLRLYATADMAYIGGGFGVGVHSVTEPAGYSLPLATGPRSTNSPDAVHLIKQQALKILNNPTDFKNWIETIGDRDCRESLGKISFDYINKGSGWTEKIFKELFINK